MLELIIRQMKKMLLPGQREKDTYGTDMTYFSSMPPGGLLFLVEDVFKLKKKIEKWL